MAFKSRRLLYEAYESVRLSNGIPTSEHGKTHQYYADAQSISTNDNPVHMLGRTIRDIGGPFTSNRVTVTGIGDPRLIRSNYNATTGLWGNEWLTLPLAHSEVKSLLLGINSNPEPLQLASFIGPKVIGAPSMSNLTAMGAKAVDMVKPTNPAADTANSFAEFLSERKFFSLPGRAGSVEGEYLNYMFGVAPTVGLVTDLRDAINDREKIIDQAIRDSGRMVRRSMKFDDVFTTSKTSGNAYVTCFGPTLSIQASSMGTWTKTVSTQQRYWFSGAFTYYLPEEGVARDLALLDRLYGVRPGLDTAWELLPFSWLADYKLSAGSAINNMNSFAAEGLVMPYAYIMCHTVTTVEYTWRGGIASSSGSMSTVELYNRVVYDQRRRERANPFGFGILPGDLSEKQLSILAALGISLVR